MARHPIGTPPGLSSNTGPLACAAWLVDRGLSAAPVSWTIVIAFDAAGDAKIDSFDEATATRFQLELFPEEWGFRFCHRGRASWIRITDIAFAHGRDEHELLAERPRLKDIGQILRRLESRHEIAFDRTRPLIDSTIAESDQPLRIWAATL
jgi:hypothetical protein